MVDALTERQRQIAERAALGYSNGEIAVELDVTTDDVRAELEAFYRTVGDRERPDQAGDVDALRDERTRQ